MGKSGKCVARFPNQAPNFRTEEDLGNRYGILGFSIGNISHTNFLATWRSAIFGGILQRGSKPCQAHSGNLSGIKEFFQQSIICKAGTSISNSEKRMQTIRENEEFSLHALSPCQKCICWVTLVPRGGMLYLCRVWGTHRSIAAIVHASTYLFFYFAGWDFPGRDLYTRASRHGGRP